MGQEWSYKIFGEIAPQAPEKVAKYQPFRDEYHHTVGHFRFTNFRKT